MWADTQDVFANGMQTLDDGAHDAKVHKELTEKEIRELRCGCGALIPAGATACPACGRVIQRRNLVEVAPGGMAEILTPDAPVQIGEKKANREWGWDAKARFIGELKTYAAQHAFKDGWVSHKYKEKFGVFPNDPRVKHAPQAPCGLDTMNWIRSRAIAWSKSRRSA